MLDFNYSSDKLWNLFAFLLAFLFKNICKHCSHARFDCVRGYCSSYSLTKSNKVVIIAEYYCHIHLICNTAHYLLIQVACNFWRRLDLISFDFFYQIHQLVYLQFLEFINFILVVSICSAN